jgi:hypothetical protein
MSGGCGGGASPVMRGRFESSFDQQVSGNQKPKEDLHYPAAVKRPREAGRRLQEAGMIDAEGRRIRKDLPADMREGQHRDFGG